jgi:transcriptional regulator with XRE-family HTH domain
MAKSYRNIREKLDERDNAEVRRKEADDRLQREIQVYEMTLAQIRRARALTQAQLARSLEVGQPEISRIEHQADLFVSTLRSYLSAMGGELHLVVEFTDGESVVVSMDDVAEAAFAKEDAPVPLPASDVAVAAG